MPKSNVEKGIIIQERDISILSEVSRWNACLGRHILQLVQFSGVRAMDKRLSKLIQSGYLQRQHYIYGVPGIYDVTPRVKQLGVKHYKHKVRLDQIYHDISVLDTAIYIHNEIGIAYDKIESERQLHSKNGFSNRKHQPDFVFYQGEEKTCVEVELSPKSQPRLEKNVKDNYTNYDCQIWVIPRTETKIKHMIDECSKKYPMQIIDMEVIHDHIQTIKKK